MRCKFVYPDNIRCTEKIITKPDKSGESTRYQVPPQSPHDEDNRFVYLWPCKPASDYCYYHDKIVNGRTTPHNKRAADHLKAFKKNPKWWLRWAV